MNHQMVQVGMDAYTGQFNVATTPVVPLNPALSNGVALNPITTNGGNYLDERVSWHFVIFPQPFGLQGEYTIGRGPQLDQTRTQVVTGSLRGGYLQAYYNYRCDTYCVSVLPYVRYQEYFGGRKFEDNSPRNSVRELELGLEYQINKAFELTIAGTFTQRNSSNSQFDPVSCTSATQPTTNPIPCLQSPYQLQSGHMVRFQLQWSY
jgi:hypothetical protein